MDRGRSVAERVWVYGRPVHNHGTEDGAGLACREHTYSDGHPIGACVAAELADAAVREPDETVHWVGDAPTSLHGNGAASSARTTRDAREVTCKLCTSLLARPDTDGSGSGS